MHCEKFFVNKKTLKIKSFMINNHNRELLELMELDNYVFNTHVEAVKQQNYFDTLVKFN